MNNLKTNLKERIAMMNGESSYLSKKRSFYNALLTFLKYLLSLVFGTFFVIFISNTIFSSFKNINIKDDKSDYQSQQDESFSSLFQFVKVSGNSDQNLINKIHDKKARDEIKSIINISSSLNDYRRNPKTSYSRSNMIFHGGPGTGKSYSAELLAKSISSYYVIVPAGRLQEIYVGSGSKR
jgi:hypothetical protein